MTPSVEKALAALLTLAAFVAGWLGYLEISAALMAGAGWLGASRPSDAAAMRASMSDELRKVLESTRTPPAFPAEGDPSDAEAEILR